MDEDDQLKYSTFAHLQSEALSRICGKLNQKIIISVLRLKVLYKREISALLVEINQEREMKIRIFDWFKELKHKKVEDDKVAIIAYSKMLKWKVRACLIAWKELPLSRVKRADQQ